jgi:exodeoxyribonuclease V alpha subunit
LKGEEMEEKEGQVLDIIYQNELNSYTIATFDIDGDELTIVGYLPFVNIGDTLKIGGRMVNHPEYGEQFKVESFEKTEPKTKEALEIYLSSGSIKGIGPATAKKIIKAFGKNTIEVMRNTPELLSTISGISQEKAIQIGENFNENWEQWKIVSFLEQFGISASQAKKVHKDLGNNAISEIMQNPYILIDKVRGVDFIKIDKMALELGMEIQNDERIQSAIKYSLNLVSYNGHCCTIKENLIQYVKNLIGVPTELIENEIINLKVKEEIYVEDRQGEQWIYDSAFYRAEDNIATRLVILKTSKNSKKIPRLETELKENEKVTEIVLSDMQKEAIKAVNENNVCVITGGPGTGKTTIIKTIINLYKAKGKEVVLCAPTGRAAKRMTEMTGTEAKTLHRLLEIGKIGDESQSIDVDINVQMIDGDIVIVDEMSMVDVFLMNYLIKAIYQGTKLILVGDIDQLPSVGPGCVLKDIINSEAIVTIHLNKIFRQAAKSKIIQNAHRVNNGQNFIKKEESDELNEDFFYVNEENKDKVLQNVLTLCRDRLKNYGDYEFFRNIQVITPTKKGVLGTKELNKELQKMLNPKRVGKNEKNYGQIVYRVGDKVMQIKNNYDIIWEKEEENGTGVFNGELGRITDIDPNDGAVKVRFDDNKSVWYEYSELEQLEHAYAITVHKSQGSEFDVVILPISKTSPMLLTRNLLYTAITRAKKLLIIIGGNKELQMMINNAESKKRNTGLEYKIRKIEGSCNF